MTILAYGDPQWVWQPFLDAAANLGPADTIVIVGDMDADRPMKAILKPVSDRGSASFGRPATTMSTTPFSTTTYSGRCPRAICTAGSIILTSSVSNIMGLPGFSAYAASKAAVRSFARSWTMELKDRNIRVNAMSPGPIDTPALATTTGLTSEQAEEAAAQFASQIPMGRRGEPDEIAAAVLFLASNESSFVTDVDLAVDGGLAQV